MNSETKKQILDDMVKKALKDAIDKVFETADLVSVIMPEERWAFVMMCGQELTSIGVVQTVIMSTLITRQCLRKDGRDGDEKLLNSMLEMVRVSLMELVVN